jgi:hypothetical protein
LTERTILGNEEKAGSRESDELDVELEDTL